jgi:hypothetical protein
MPQLTQNGSVTGYRDRALRGFSLVCQGEWRESNSQLYMTASFQILSSSAFTIIFLISFEATDYNLCSSSFFFFFFYSRSQANK